MNIRTTPERRWTSWLAWLLAAFFAAAGLGNVFPTEAIAQDYLRWGYPAWFHLVTGAIELTAAALMARRALRPWGAMLGATVMFGASVTVLHHGEYLHAAAPLVVLATTAVLAVVSGARSEAGKPAAKPHLFR